MGESSGNSSPSRCPVDDLFLKIVNHVRLSSASTGDRCRRLFIAGPFCFGEGLLKQRVWRKLRKIYKDDEKAMQDVLSDVGFHRCVYLWSIISLRLRQ